MRSFVVVGARPAVLTAFLTCSCAASQNISTPPRALPSKPLPTVRRSRVLRSAPNLVVVAAHAQQGAVVVCRRAAGSRACVWSTSSSSMTIVVVVVVAADECVGQRPVPGSLARRRCALHCCRRNDVADRCAPLERNQAPATQVIPSMSPAPSAAAVAAAAVAPGWPACALVVRSHAAVAGAAPTIGIGNTTSPPAYATDGEIKVRKRNACARILSERVALRCWSSG